MWCAKFEDEWEEPNPLHWYLAQIAFEVRRSNARAGWRGRIAQFILQFTRAEPMFETAAEATAAAKAAWRARLGE